MSKVKSILNEQFYTALGITPYLLRPEFNLPIFEHLEKEAVAEPTGFRVSESIAVQPSIEPSKASTSVESATFSDATSSTEATEKVSLAAFSPSEQSDINTMTSMSQTSKSELSALTEKKIENAKIPSPAVEMHTVPREGNEDLVSQTEALTSEPVMESLAEPTLPTVHWVVLGEGLSDVWQSEMSRQWRLWQNILQVWCLPVSSTQFIDTQVMMDETRLESQFESVLETGAEVILAFESSQTHPLVEMLSEGMEVILIPSLMDMLESGHAKQRFYQTMVEANQHLPGLLPHSF